MIHTTNNIGDMVGAVMKGTLTLTLPLINVPGIAIPSTTSVNSPPSLLAESFYPATSTLASYQTPAFFRRQNKLTNR